MLFMALTTKTVQVLNRFEFRRLYIIPVVYVIAVSVYMIWHRAWLSPDQFFGFAIFGALFIGRIKQFLQDWIPVLLLLFGYEYLRGVVPFLSQTPHIYPMINADLMIFGYLPTIKLQTLLFSSNIIHWYDYFAVTLYIAHFVVPMVIAFVFWLHDRKLFKEYASAFLVLSYMAFFTYIIFPAMPPWMASNLGYLPPLAKIMDQVMGSFAHPISVPSIYQFFGANLVAAIPSIHAAYPWLIFLFLFKKYRFLSFLSLPYVFGVWFAVVYLGEHYAIDVLIGIFYATMAFAVVDHFISKNKAKILKPELL
jgi:hypothetical protein